MTAFCGAVGSIPGCSADLPFADCRRVTVRAITPYDIDVQRAFFRRLSGEARYMRFMGLKAELSDALLRQLSAADGRGHVAWMAEVVENGRATMIAEARYVVDEHDPSVCEFALSVADNWHGRGIASKLLEMLECHARNAGVRRMAGDTLPNNAAMIALARKSGYAVSLNCRDPRTMRLSKRLFIIGQATAKVSHYGWSAAA